MIVFQDPDTGAWIRANTAESVPDGVPYKEVPAHAKDEYIDIIIDYDVDGLPVYDADKKIEVDRRTAKVARNQALEDLAYDFGDGRVIQVRPQDESNIRNAIDLMTSRGIPDLSWRMKDNTVAVITAAELQTALEHGQLAALSIWETYNAN